ncbi:hypothetical protein D9M69_567680 [compost metagenome]
MCASSRAYMVGGPSRFDTCPCASASSMSAGEKLPRSTSAAPPVSAAISTVPMPKMWVIGRKA